MENEELIFIPNNTPSLKNSKIATSRGVFSSKTVKKYLGLLGIQNYSPGRKEVKGYVNRPNLFEQLRPQFEKALEGKEAPFNIGLHFVRDSKRKFDFNNANQIIADLMVAHDIIEDDNMDFYLPYPLILDDKAYSYNKEKPGVWLKIS